MLKRDMKVQIILILIVLTSCANQTQKLKKQSINHKEVAKVLSPSEYREKFIDVLDEIPSLKKYYPDTYDLLIKSVALHRLGE